MHQIGLRRLLALLVAIGVVIAAAVVWVDRSDAPVIALEGLSGEQVLTILADHHASKDIEVCAEEESSDYEDETEDHMLVGTADLPSGVVELLEQRGRNPDDYEMRHHEQHRLLLVSWDMLPLDHEQGYREHLGSVYELHFFRGAGESPWGIAYSGSVFECPPNWPDAE